MEQPLWVWIAFNTFVVIMISADLFFFHKNVKEKISLKQAGITSMLWILLAFAFNYGIYLYLGKEQALNFLAGYLIEESLSIDNLFVFLLLFKYFHTPEKSQHKVLFWGILGAIVMRAFFIFFGVALVESFHWILYLFGAFLIYGGIKMALSHNEMSDPEGSPVVRLLKRWIPITPDYVNDHFFVKQNNKWFATPLFVVLMMVETTDVVFAVDSIPAVMSITRDPFIIYTSNIFAILGLRSLYFVLSGLMSLFHYLHYGLAFILVFVGSKMLLEGYIHIPIGIVLGILAGTLTITVALSLLFPKKNKD